MTRLTVLIGALGVGLPPTAAPAQTRPSTPLVLSDYHPGECVDFGAWVASEPVIVFAHEGDTLRIAYTIAPADTFIAHAGNLHVLVAGRVRVVRPVEFAPNDAPRRYETLVPGDTIYVYGDGSEGWYPGWYRGRQGSFDLNYASPGDTVQAWHDSIVETRWRTRYWVRVTDRAGREGWVDVDRHRTIDMGCTCC